MGTEFDERNRHEEDQGSSDLSSLSMPNRERADADSQPDGASQEGTRERIESVNKASPDETSGARRQEEELKQLLTERVYGVIDRMCSFLEITIDRSEYPSVVVDRSNGGTSSYNSCGNLIALNVGHIESGFVIGEEVAHWLHAKCRVSANTNTSVVMIDRKNGEEFIGYVGRGVACRACRGTEFEELFKKDDVGAPEDSSSLLDNFYQSIERAQKIDDRRREYRNKLDSIKGAVEELCIRAIYNPGEDREARVWLIEGILNQSLAIEEIAGFTWESLDERSREMLRSSSENFAKYASNVEPLRESNEDLWHKEFLKSYLRMFELQVLILREAIPDVLTNLMNHGYGYIAGAIWLEENKEDLKSARSLFYMSPGDLNEQFVDPVFRQKPQSSPVKFTFSGMVKRLASTFGIGKEPC